MPPEKSRIVIDLDQGKKSGRSAKPARAPELGQAPEPGWAAKPPRASRGSVGKVLGVIAVLLILIAMGVAAGSYFWWQSYKSKPAYSLALLADAVQRDDMKTFDELVDTDKIVDNLIPQVTDQAVEKYGSFLSTSVRKQIATLLPKVLPGIKQNVHGEIVKQVKEIAAQAQGRPFFLIALALPYLVKIDQQGDTAKAAIDFQNRHMELSMQRNGDRWKIMAVKDDALVDQVLSSIASKGLTNLLGGK